MGRARYDPQDPTPPEEPGAVPHPEPVEGRAFLHVDLDAFFASIVQRDRPDLRGRPVVVGGRADRPGRVASASYEARARGVHAGMTLAAAHRRCPDATFLAVDVQRCLRDAARFHTLLRAFRPRTEPLGLDEAYLRAATPGEAAALELARRIQAGIRDRLRLTASVGISDVKGLARVATRWAKPAGMATLPRSAIRRRLWPLGVETLPGIGPAAAARLARIGCRSIGDLARLPAAAARRALGAQASAWQALVRGTDRSGIVPVEARPARALAVEYTVPDTLFEARRTQQVAAGLCARLAARAQHRDLAGLRIVVRYRDARGRVHQRAIASAQAAARCEELLGCVTRVLHAEKPWKQGIRTLGVRLEGLLDRRAARPQALAFPAPARRRTGSGP